MVLGIYQEALGPPLGQKVDEEGKGRLLPTGCACSLGTALPPTGRQQPSPDCPRGSQGSPFSAKP